MLGIKTKRVDISQFESSRHTKKVKVLCSSDGYLPSSSHKSVQFALRADFDALIQPQLQLSSFVLEKPSLVGSIGVAELTFVYQR